MVTSRRPGLPPALDGVLAKALAKAPGDRFASCCDFADALRGTLGLQPYGTGPGIVREAYPATRFAWPTGEGRAQQAGPAAATVPPGRGPGRANLPTGEASYPAPPQTPAAAQGYPGHQGYAGYPGYQAGYGGNGGQAQPAGRRRGLRIAVVTGTAVAVLAAAGVVAAVLAHSHGPVPVISAISAKSALPPVTSDVYVVYQGGTEGSASLTGDVKDVTSGEVAKLFAQQFPYQRAPAPDGSVTLHPVGGTARYAFQVTPTLATHYQVEVFKNSTATASLASSATSTVYVTSGATFGTGQTCARPVCRETIPVHVFVPATALSTEITKHWYTYFNLNLAPSVEPAPPTLLLLGEGDPQVSTPQRVSATEFELTISFSFAIGNDAYHWRWNTCLRDTEAQDGLGLPGYHGCGNPSVLATTSYIG